MKREKNPNQVMPAMVTKPVAVKRPEEPVVEIDTEKAVAFGTNLALMMKQKQQAEDALRVEETEIVYRKRNQQYSAEDLEAFRRKLLSARAAYAEQTATVRDTAGLHDEDDVEPDGGDGTNQTLRVDAINRLEKTNRSINDIDEALRRIDEGTYGVCLTCGCLIAKQRLVHSPFAMTCTACQQKLEAGRTRSAML